MNKADTKIPERTPSRYLVTSALPYANGPIHIGHLVGAYLPADIYVRYLRSMGRDVLYVCGSDEHGVAITIRARQEGLSPQQVIDKYHPLIRDSLQQFGISFDNYSRTSLPIHHETAAGFFRTFHERGLLDAHESAQFYDPQAGIFLPDRYVTGECPVCHHPRAYGDQCENCGSSLSPTDLIGPKSTLSGATPELRSTRHWFLPLDKMQAEWLQGYVDAKQDHWKANVYGQCQSWLKAGLQPRAITRDLDWGIPVPLEGAEGKVLYVWFDAPIGYISSSREWAEKRGTPDAWKPYWQDPDTELVHFIGKDNIVFHTLIFPAMLHYEGSYIVPSQVPANEFLNLEGNKMSTSRNYAVWLHEYLAAFPDKVDVLRYVLAATMPETKDNDFSWKDYQARNNNELVAILGNFVNRVLTLIQKYYGGTVPPCPATQADVAERAELHRALQAEQAQYAQSLEKFRFRDALTALMNMARAGNKYLADTEPWKRIQTDEAAVQAILYTATQLVAQLAVYAEPFLPGTAQQLGLLLDTPVPSLAQLHQQDAWQLVPAGRVLPQPTLLFTKIEDSTIAEQQQKLEAALAASAAQALPTSAPEDAVPMAAPVPAPKPEVAFPDFEKLDIRIATITAAERVPKADRLLKLTLDTGLDTRTVVSGIAEHYAPEDLVGQRVSVLLNLAPRKLKGIESQGMVLMAEGPDGKLRFVQPQEQAPAELPNGSVVR